MDTVDTDILTDTTITQRQSNTLTDGAYRQIERKTLRNKQIQRNCANRLTQIVTGALIDQ